MTQEGENAPDEIERGLEATLFAAEEPLTVDDLAAHLGGLEKALVRDGLKALMDEYERNLIESALRRHKGRVADVLRELNLPRRTLNEKMTRHGLTRDQTGMTDLPEG